MSRTTTSLEASTQEIQDIELVAIGSPASLTGRYSLHRTHDGPALNIGESPADSTNGSAESISKWRATIIIGTISCLTLSNSMLTGLLIVSLPTMAHDIGLSEDLLLWPPSANYLSCACTLLISGSIADVVGAKKVFLIGEFFLIATAIACGACRTGFEAILFRAAQGIALSLCLPSSVSLITSSIPVGSYRNIAFACLGAGQPFGFSVGLVLGGFFVDNIGWRYGYYIGAILIFIIFAISIFAIPSEVVTETRSFQVILRRMKTEIDWIGCVLLSTPLGIFSYLFAVIAGGKAHFLEPVPLSLFLIAVILVPIFIWYSRRQERLGRKVIIPPSLWKNRVFTSLCIVVFLMWATSESMQFFLTLFYQSVQHLSAMQTSIRFLPMVVIGSVTNLLTGWLVKRVRADVLLLGSALVSAIAPVLLAIVNPEWSYWTCAFLATACLPVCGDVLFTVAVLLITSVFPPQTHGLAGGVFNTVSNIGKSVGLAVASVVASSVTVAENDLRESTPQSLMEGYRATFWLCFGVDILVLSVVGLGLRKIGKVGIKRE